MSQKDSLHARTWIEIHRLAAEQNIRTFRELAGNNVFLWAVVKSNAYGHGLFVFPRLALATGLVDGLCVDSLVEAIALREDGVEAPILVIGPTHPDDVSVAARNNVVLSIATFEDIAALEAAGQVPEFHLKVDTGFHRRGFYIDDLPEVIKRLQGLNDKRHAISDKPNAGLSGIYTHFSSAKNMDDTTYADQQLVEFARACDLLNEAGFSGLMRHCAATSATLISKKYHLDAVRVGIGLYGLWPSPKLVGQKDGVELAPALSWHASIAEVKLVKRGDYIGYNMTERMNRDGKIAVLPVGYWFGLSRHLSHVGEVLVHGKRARILGKVSMDLCVVDVSDIPCKPGDTATIIGISGDERIHADELANNINTINYEIVTRTNPLIDRRVV